MKLVTMAVAMNDPVATRERCDSLAKPQTP
jgi:hypothetical protein